MKVSALYKPTAPKADPAAEAEYRRRLYAAHRAAGWEHGDALAHTDRDTRWGLWRRAFPGLGLGPLPADVKPVPAASRSGGPTLFDPMG